MKFANLETTIGIETKSLISEVRNIVEAKLVELSGNSEWFVGIDYNSSFS